MKQLKAPLLGLLGAIVFAMTANAHILGRVYCVDTGLGIPGVTVTIGCDNVASESRITDANGNYDFFETLYPPCSVTVDLSTLPAGVVSICPTTVAVGDFVVDPAIVDFCFSCGATCAGQIGDFVWNDLNGNGCQDAGEPGISGVTVDLYSGCAPGSTTLIKSTTTDASGKYLFDSLCAGQYSVRFHTPNGFVHTLAKQSCNVGGQPSEATDSNCECTGSADCDVCVNLPTDNSVNLTIDCGYVGGQPCVEFTKVADPISALVGSPITYTYTITNCGSTTLTDLAIVDDAGTPGVPADDFTVASGITLAPGETKTFSVTLTPPIPLCAGSGSPSPSAGTLDVEVLASGDIKVTLRQSRNLNDNVYGTPAPADGWSSHKFGDLTGSDKAEFRFTDGGGKVVLDFYLDYISAGTSKTFPSGTVNYPSGYGTLGANGGDGGIIAGSAANVLFATTTLTENLNSGLNGGFPSPYTVNSPTPESSFPNWDYVNGYTVVISQTAFGAAGFGGVTIPYIHNSPAKTGNNQVSPTPCGSCITNIANVVTVVGGNTIGPTLATDSAEVCIGNPPPQVPPCVLSPGALKIDKKTVQLPIKNNGAVAINLSSILLNWNESVNGKLVKASLNGDFWTGSLGSPIALSSGFNADANRRKIDKGQTKTLVLTFENNASKTLSDYSGAISFGADASCQVAIPPATQPSAFTCDGHLAEIAMRWTGAQTINVIAHYGGISAAVIATVNGVPPNGVVTVGGYASSPNDVVWEIYDAVSGAKIGNSDFHLSCSDSDMNGPDDCGKPEGDGKALAGTWITTWQIVSMTTKNGTTFTCP